MRLRPTWLVTGYIYRLLPPAFIGPWGHPARLSLDPPLFKIESLPQASLSQSRNLSVGGHNKITRKFTHVKSYCTASMFCTE